jgi:hypothetical protein
MGTIREWFLSKIEEVDNSEYAEETGGDLQLTTIRGIAEEGWLQQGFLFETDEDAQKIFEQHKTEINGILAKLLKENDCGFSELCEMYALFCEEDDPLFMYVFNQVNAVNIALIDLSQKLLDEKE